MRGRVGGGRGEKGKKMKEWARDKEKEKEREREQKMGKYNATERIYHSNQLIAAFDDEC